MLLLKDVYDEVKCDVTIDYYVPFTINVESNNVYGTCLCWRTGDLKKSLIEVSMDKDTGLLTEITLVSIDEVCIVENKMFDVSNKIKGTPAFIFDGEIKNGLCDQPGSVEVELGLDYLLVRLDKKVDEDKYIELNRVTFGIDHNDKLLSITIKDLTDYEYSELKEAFLKL